MPAKALLSNLNKYNVVLASKSPRRQQLLQGLEIPFEVRTLDVNEDFPGHLKGAEIPIYLSEVKAAAFRDQMADNELIITADTVVWIDNEVLNKPESREEAMEMLRKLSGKMHEVFTAVMLSTKERQSGFCDVAKVYFTNLTELEIEHYVDHYQPFDKAGAYGVQELIGYIGIERLEGSYFTVMGLPVQKLYEKLKEF
jgi:septum formation protein